MMELVVATRNAGKLKEIRRLLEVQGITVLGLDRFPKAPEVAEDGDTFALNATKKSGNYCQIYWIAVSGGRFRSDCCGLTGSSRGSFGTFFR